MIFLPQIDITPFQMQNLSDLVHLEVKNPFFYKTYFFLLKNKLFCPPPLTSAGVYDKKFAQEGAGGRVQ